MDWDTFVSIREIQVLAGMSIHPNVVRLFDAIVSTKWEYCLVYEYANQGSLESYVNHLLDVNTVTGNQPLLPDEQVRSIISDALKGLQHIHAHGFFHRDIKPGNLLLSDGVCKVGDFTLARPLRNTKTTNGAATPLTTYVSTRWYRAPELLLRGHAYGTEVDIFAMGCVAAEIYDSKARPFFVADTEAGQLDRILCTLGTPTQDTWPEGVSLMRSLRLEHPPMPESLDEYLPNFLNQTTIDWFRSMLALVPDRRLTATQALAHDFLSSGQPGIHVFDPSFSSEDEDPAYYPSETEETYPTPKVVFVRNPYKKTRGR